MSEFSGFWTTESGSPVGDQVASYSQVQLGLALEIVAACNGRYGVAPGFGDGLAGTAGSNSVTIATGAVFADGRWYQNDDDEVVAIPSAVGGGNTRIDRLVLRVDHAAFTARLHRIAGTDASAPTVPAVVTTPGTTYDITLYQAHVTTGGVVTLTDERQWSTVAIDNSTLVVDDDNGQLAFRQALGLSVVGRAAPASGEVSDIVASSAGDVLHRWGDAIAFGQLNGVNSILPASIDDTLIGNRVPRLTNRQGGDADEWADSGTTDYTPTAVRMQVGSGDAGTISAGNYDDITITFPAPFSDLPLVILTPHSRFLGTTSITAVTNAVTASGFTARLTNTGPGSDAIGFQWLAVGP